MAAPEWATPHGTSNSRGSRNRPRQKDTLVPSSPGGGTPPHGKGPHAPGSGRHPHRGSPGAGPGRPQSHTALPGPKALCRANSSRPSCLLVQEAGNCPLPWLLGISDLRGSPAYKVPFAFLLSIGLLSIRLLGGPGTRKGDVPSPEGLRVQPGMEGERKQYVRTVGRQLPSLRAGASSQPALEAPPLPSKVTRSVACARHPGLSPRPFRAWS